MSARASLAPGPREPVVCRPEGERPDIVMLLAESVMPPGVYPSLEYPEEAAAYFRSFDGQIRRLRVETFGGGTWLTDFSVLTGMSTSMFGTMRNFAAQLSTGRVRHSLPQYLKACGYEATIVYPSRADFAGSARFYRSIGFDRIIDRKVHRAPDERQRDAFYLEQARKVIDAAGKGAKTGEGAARRPQFVLVSTMSNHSPWNFRFAPEAMVPGDGGPWTGDPEFDEYLWRIVLARRDFDAFRADLARDHPNRPFLFVTYGDHQPALARLPLENATEIADRGAAWQLDPASRAFETFYAFDGLNFTPRLPDFEAPILEASHLATLTVIAAGLPLDEVYARRLQLLEQCRGLYATCADRENVTGFQRWLADSGWIVQR
jgi:phosphoglycerol transferase MdoB-like AlkP superfamily enzyme